MPGYLTNTETRAPGTQGSSASIPANLRILNDDATARRSPVPSVGGKRGPGFNKLLPRSTDADAENRPFPEGPMKLTSNPVSY